MSDASKIARKALIDRLIYEATSRDVFKGEQIIVDRSVLLSAVIEIEKLQEERKGP